MFVEQGESPDEHVMYIIQPRYSVSLKDYSSQEMLDLEKEREQRKKERLEDVLVE
jgi:hypothetical protein